MRRMRVLRRYADYTFSCRSFLRLHRFYYPVIANIMEMPVESLHMQCWQAEARTDRDHIRYHPGIQLVGLLEKYE